jgi:hypothetical protein
MRALSEQQWQLKSAHNMDSGAFFQLLNVPILFALPSLQSAFYRDYTVCTSYGRIKTAPVLPIASGKRLA